jgi:pimeloyl-ACP methyl ester carboxylesterase
MKFRRRLWLATVAATLLTVSACSLSAPKPSASMPEHNPAPVECPDDVAGAVVSEIDCAIFTVPESRQQGDRVVQLFVATVRAPKAAPVRPDPVLVTSLSSQPNYAGIAPLAQRVGRDVVLVDTRGTGHSLPSLECPEVGRTDPGVWAEPDPTGVLAEAVQQCYARLTASGVAVASYDLVEAAADLEALRQALGIEQWNVTAYGNGSRLAVELLRQAPDTLRTLTLDSPDPPGLDPREVAGPATESAAHRALAACAADHRCRQRYPDPEALLAKATKTLQENPLTVSIDHRGAPTDVLVTPAFLARALRQLVSDGGSSGPLFAVGSIPSVLDAVASRRSHELNTIVAQLIQHEDPLCLGYRTPCLPVGRGSIGVQLTVLCRDVAPFPRPDPVALETAFDAAYATGFWSEACKHWPVDQADVAVAAPPVATVPTLVTLGEFGPYSPESTVRRSLAGLSAASYIVAFGRPHNVLPTPCVATVRNRWIDDPQPFTGNPCREPVRIRWN